ncbi:hypothetical protein [Pleomorphomonas oryzae]|uniref:hypothetical protein n=1 Tax=Pleomorphomonas oryzae TaxID=261934 RepID=UPI0004155913|nr:hypothetical protein [Pleomorphomonas oryzae]
MMPPCPVYLFRSSAFAPSGDTVVIVAPLDQVVAVYGGGGMWGEAGLSSAFGGVAIFRNDASGERFAGVWGARNAARFRRELQAHMSIAVIDEAPNARLVFFETKSGRPPKPA